MIEVQENLQGYYSDRYALGSIGAIGHISPASASRLKGFIVDVVRDAQSASLFNGIIRTGLSRMSNGASSQPTRLSVRAVVKNAPEDIGKDEIFKAANMEASIELNDDYCIVYAGYNSSARSSMPYHQITDTYLPIVQDAWRSMQDAWSFKKFFDSETHNASMNGYSVREVGPSDIETDYMRLISLLCTFGYGPNESDAIIRDHGNLIVGAYKGSELVGLGIAELRCITLNSGEAIRIAELTDAFVAPTHRGNNLYFLISTHEMLGIIRRHRDTDLIYGESNLDEVAVLKSAARQGRKFAGILPDHAIIGDSAKSLAVTYLNKNDMLEISNCFGV